MQGKGPRAGAGPGVLHRFHEGCDDREGSEGRRANGEALTDGRRGVAELVQGVGDLPRAFAEAAHLRDAPGVIGYGTVGVDSHGDADGGQHTQGRDAHAVKTGELGGSEDDGADGEHGNHHGLHAHGEARNHDRGRARFPRFGDAHDGLGARVVLGGETDHDATDGASNHGHPNVSRDAGAGDDEVGHADKEDRGADGAEAKGRRRLPVGHEANKHDAHEGADQTRGGQEQGQAHEGGAGFGFVRNPRCEAREGCDAKGGGDGDGGDHGAAVGLEDVRAHASDVTHVVPDIVGDDAGVAGIIFRDARFHLADEVRAHVGALGEDAAAHAREEGHGGGAHAKAMDVVRAFRVTAEEVVEGAKAEEAQGGHAQTHDGAAEEGHGEGLGGAEIMGSDGGAYVGLGGRVHANPAREGTRTGPHHEGDGSLSVQREVQCHHEDTREHKEHRVFPAHEHHGAEVNGITNLLHLTLTFGIALHHAVDHEGSQ